MPLGGLAVQPGAVGIPVAGAHAPQPPLLEPRHRHVVQAQIGVDPQQVIAGPPQPDAQLVILADQHGRVEAADLTEGLDADHDVAVRAVHLARRHVPFEIGQLLVGRGLGEPLAAAAGDEGHVGALLEDAQRPIQPALDQLAIAVHELDVADLRVDPAESLEAGVAAVGRAVGLRGVFHEDVRAQGTRQLGTAVGRVPVHVDDRETPADHRPQGGSEPLPLIPANRDDPELTHRASSTGPAARPSPCPARLSRA